MENSSSLTPSNSDLALEYLRQMAKINANSGASADDKRANRIDFELLADSVREGNEATINHLADLEKQRIKKLNTEQH